MMTAKDFERMKKAERNDQYIIPKKINYFTTRYNLGLVTWVEAQKLYKIAVDTVLTIFGVKVLSEIPFGQGYERVRIIFAKLLEETQAQRQKDLEEKKQEQIVVKIESIFKEGGVEIYVEKN